MVKRRARLCPKCQGEMVKAGLHQWTDAQRWKCKSCRHCSVHPIVARNK